MDNEHTSAEQADNDGANDQANEVTAADDEAVADVDEVGVRRGATGVNAREHGWPPWASAYIASLARVPDRTWAAQQAGVHRSTTIRLADRDASFAEAERQARDEALDRLERMMYQRASVGQPVKKTVTKTNKDGSTETTVVEESHVSDVLAIFYMKRWRPEYRDTFKVEQSGPDGGPIRVETERKMDEAAQRLDAEVVRLADARAARDAAGGGGG